MAATAGCLAILTVFAFGEAKGQDIQLTGFALASDVGSGIGCATGGCGADYGYGDGCGVDCGCGTECGSDCGCGCGCGLGQHRTSVFFEVLYLHPTGVDMAHAQQQNGIGGAGTVPWGRIGALDPDSEFGGRIGVNWALDGCSSVAVTYTQFESTAVDQVFPPTIPGGGGVVGSLVHHPGAAITASVGPVDAAYGIDFKLMDIDFRSLFRSCDTYWLNYSAGVRIAHLDQDFAQRGRFAGGNAGTIGTLSQINFDGAGIKLGVDGERMIGCRGFSVYGKAAVSPMVGQFGSRYTMANLTTDVLLADAYWTDDRFVTMLEYEVGVAWTSCNECWRFSLGYMASFWYNAVTTPEFVNAVQANDYVDLGDTISFDGVTARVERRW